MADMAVDLDHGVDAGKAVQHASVLHIAALLEHDAAEVAAQRGERGDVAAGADEHVADQHGVGMHVGGGMDDRADAVDFVAGHGWAPMGWDSCGRQ